MTGTLDELSEILPELYVGSMYASRSEKLLTARGITHVLNVKESARYPENPPYRWKHIPLSDYGDTDLSAPLEQCFEFLDTAAAAGGKALVHCSLGSNRSPTVVMAYLVARRGWTLERSYWHVLERRPQACPHETYFRYLQNLEIERTGRCTLSEVEREMNVQEHIRSLRTSTEEQ